MGHESISLGFYSVRWEFIRNLFVLVARMSGLFIQNRILDVVLQRSFW